MPAYSDDSSWASKPAHKRDFEWSKTSEPHKPRNKLIIEEFPEIKALMGHDPATKYKIFAAFALQVCMHFSVLPTTVVSETTTTLMIITSRCFWPTKCGVLRGQYFS